MHALLLIWTKSKHYNTSSRLVPLLQLLMDSLIAQTRSFVPGKAACSLLWRPAVPDVAATCRKGSTNSGVWRIS